MKKLLVAISFMLLSFSVFAQAIVTPVTGGLNPSQLSAQAGQNQASTATGMSEIQTGAVAVNSYGANSVKTTGQGPGQAFGVSFSADNCASTAGVSGGWLGGDAGVAIPIDKWSCISLRVYERLQQGAASEAADRTTQYKDDHGIVQTVQLRDALKDASYEVLAEIDPRIRGILSRRGVIHGQAAVDYDPSGTTGMQPANYRVEAKADTKQ